MKLNNEPHLLPVRVYGDVILRIKSLPVKEFDDKLREFARDLTHTMYQRDGVGLAANQVGSTQRVFVIDTCWSREEGEPTPIVMVNPVIHEGEGEYEMEEGCISVPGIYAKVKRYNYIKYSYFDTCGIEHKGEAEGYDAVVIQHEYDHLDGILFVDRLSKLSMLKIKRKLNAIMSTAENGQNIRTEIYKVNEQ